MTHRPTRLMALAASACVALAAVGMLATPAQAQPAAPAQVAPDYSGTSGVIPWSAIMEKPLAAGPSHSGASKVPDGTDTSNGAGNASHEELSQSSLKQSIREFNAGDNAVKKPETTEENATANPLRKPVTSAAAKAAQKSQHDPWAAITLRDEMIDAALPWAFGLGGLLTVGFAGKVWLNYMQAKAARPGMRRRSARKRSRSSSSRSGSFGGSAGSDGSPQSQIFVSSLSGLGGQGSAGNAGSSTSSSGASVSASGSSARRRRRSNRSQP